MFIDVQAKALFWLVAAWESDFTGYVLDYGTEPDQKADYFTLRDIRRTLAAARPARESRARSTLAWSGSPKPSSAVSGSVTTARACGSTAA
jgi:hypothetical protein